MDWRRCHCLRGFVHRRRCNTCGFRRGKDSAYVGNNAVIADHAVVQDNAIVCDGYISGNSCICGNAILNSDEKTRCAPMIGGNARVYGELTGNVVCQGSAIVLPGVKLYNTTADCFVLKDDTVSVVPAQGRKSPHQPRQKKQNTTKMNAKTKGRCL